MNEDVGALDDAGVDASVPDADVAVAPKLKAGVLELKLGAAADAVAFAVVLDEVPEAEDPKEKAALPVPVAVSVLAALKEKAEEEADEEAPPPKPPGFASDPNVKLAVTGALSPFGADEPNEEVADEKLEHRAAGVATLASAESAILAAPEPASAAGFAAAGAATGSAPNVIAAGASLVSATDNRHSVDC